VSGNNHSLIFDCENVRSAHLHRTLLFTAFNHLHITCHIWYHLNQQIVSCNVRGRRGTCFHTLWHLGAITELSRPSIHCIKFLTGV